jgi:hypothetical protein
MTGLPEWADREVYLPLAQAMYIPPALSLIARVGGEAEGFEKHLPKMIQEVCPNCAVNQIASMETLWKARSRHRVRQRGS